MMFDKNAKDGGSRFLSHEQNIKKCFFLSTDLILMKSLIISLTKISNFALLPSPTNERKIKIKLHQFHMFCNKVKIIAKNDKSLIYKWRERSMAQLWYLEDFPLSSC